MKLSLKSGDVELPAFFPDATRGVVRCVDSQDLTACNIPGLVMNAYHLLTKPGPAVIKALGGLHSFCGWQGPILTDSGGFQVFSLIRENKKFGEIRANEVIFRPEGKNSKKIIISPEKCIQAQFAYGSDIIMCLDYCTHPDDPDEINRKSVDTTIRWAKRCKDEYNKLSASGGKKPAIFGIIQGGRDLKLREECARALIEIGFDGFGFGGWPLDNEGRLTEDILEYTAKLMPDDKPKYAMGLGRPEGILACSKMGYNLFDCVIPTREARHNRLYVFNENYKRLADIDLKDSKFYTHFYPLDDIYRRDSLPISHLCACHACKNYSRAYIRHLLAIGDSLGQRLCTIHNLYFYNMLMGLIKNPASLPSV